MQRKDARMELTLPHRTRLAQNWTVRWAVAHTLQLRFSLNSRDLNFPSHFSLKLKSALSFSSPFVYVCSYFWRQNGGKQLLQRTDDSGIGIGIGTGIGGSAINTCYKYDNFADFTELWKCSRLTAPLVANLTLNSQVSRYT